MLTLPPKKPDARSTEQQASRSGFYVPITRVHPNASSGRDQAVENSYPVPPLVTFRSARFKPFHLLKNRWLRRLNIRTRFVTHLRAGSDIPPNLYLSQQSGLDLLDDLAQAFIFGDFFPQPLSLPARRRVIEPSRHPADLWVTDPTVTVHEFNPNLVATTASSLLAFFVDGNG